MALFMCENCNCVENTACSDYWIDKIEGNPLLCSECQYGKWHDKFEKVTAKGCFIDNDGFVYFPEEVNEEKMEWKYNPQIKMIDKI